jgi:hypothetical protein
VNISFLCGKLFSDQSDNVFLRLFLYVTIWYVYIVFMGHHAPSGVEWAGYHSQRMFNAIEYLRLYGYFTNFGYSIWSSCTDCDLSSPTFAENIYVSATALKLAPYIILNNLGGEEAFRYFGSAIDKVVIFTTGVIATELLCRGIRQRSGLPLLWVSAVCFSLFVTSPWTYMMLIAGWADIWFLLFFLLAILCFNSNRRCSGFIFFFTACLMHYISGLVVAFIWTSTFILAVLLKEREFIKFFIPKYCNDFFTITTLLGLSALSLTLEFGLRFLFLSTRSVETDGSSLLVRIGISGTDPHNGGLLGALQFLGGSRITVCFGDLSGFFTRGLEQKIAAYNCSLSIAGMAVVSSLALVGAAYLLKHVRELRPPLFSLLVTLLIFVSVLQQSLSVHLMGHSYIFTFIFVAGLLGLIIRFESSVKSSVLSIIFLTPLVTGVILLSIRTSMLGGYVG